MSLQPCKYETHNFSNQQIIIPLSRENGLIITIDQFRKCDNFKKFSDCALNPSIYLFATKKNLPTFFVRNEKFALMGVVTVFAQIPQIHTTSNTEKYHCHQTVWKYFLLSKYYTTANTFTLLLESTVHYMKDYVSHSTLI